ncbi:MAG: DNA repair protein RadC [Myxococcota bacterium]
MSRPVASRRVASRPAASRPAASRPAASRPAASRPAASRPDARERLAQAGPAALNDRELLIALLGAGHAGVSADALARRILADLGGLEGLATVSRGELLQVPGIGVALASRILAALELGCRALTRPLDKGRPLRSSRDVDEALRPRLARQPQEHFFALPLDTKHRPLGELLLAKGGLAVCPVEPRTVFRALLREGAAAVVFVHNHPSGVPTPSQDDIELTDRLRRAGALLGVDVLDHVIIGAEGYYSFRDSDWLLLEPLP